ncbi:MAG: FprA family A-type flavoprotein [Lachnospiraceae bacterium]|nr:FprA family A-type flavoprotein [Lachnospiraceae bacterium]
MAGTKIMEQIYYVGMDDRTIDLFESQYKVPEGVSYNSYVIMDEKIAVMDTVDSRATDGWLENVEEVLGGASPDLLVISHMEPDHSGSIEALVQKYPQMQLVGNAKTFTMLEQFFALDLTGRKVIVREGESIPLGKRSLQFFMAPMVHWPEVMVAYEPVGKILFSADGFGTFGALGQDKLRKAGGGDWAEEARRYYFNIVGKYGAPVQTLLKKAAKLDIAAICPLHGPVLTEDLGYHIGLYDTWSRYEAEEEGIVIAYASIHGHTAAAAKELAQIFRTKGEDKVEVYDLCRCDMSQAVAAAFRYDKMVLAAATYDGGLFPPMEDFLHHLKAKTYQKRRVGLVENATWAPMAAKVMQKLLEEMKDIRISEKIVTIRSALDPQDRTRLEELAESL